MLDYGHNPAGYSQAIRACRQLGQRRLLGVIGMPGDRMEAAIRSVGGQCAGAFDRIDIKEDRDLRGRERGEVAGLLYDAVLRAGFPKSGVRIVEDELDALKKALSEAMGGDLVAVFYERLGPLKKYLLDLGAKAYNPGISYGLKAPFPLPVLKISEGAARAADGR